ncbi:MAG: acyl-ACP--UDP-N-acetylglucosamine O-acyltransferase [Alphaproteobacteria bacterium]|nr:acyl-ACP--UDP-N-acetylglucosamine O-acyltransferase [Alphaproteobacteria bacterium]MCZ6609763.1 acyl-ACP--UDP-N-acetylglucosamine O-acyltransferase [Alphaproteobacteria bacterium]MCZ6742423.1 acyl-ACP--UDP-N-acetylglucosamine O-acyltransferase [Alphaproteobacteria bacterium]MCZ6814446.1 acyl-ACP--UDP-N-acetylglucosamine O-acyltransferase [Alphaproteobacteria bacterium]MCZ6849427.1 acyl-ACP--UDP-N-acetylglucosamine O-acyltransferase [Alphaproteobacteria bacterium]
MTEIHPTAIIDPAAEVGEGVSIGPYCCVGPHVRLGASVKLQSHVVVDGRTEIGANSEVYPFAVIGARPQDLKYKGEPSQVVIGQRTVIREHVTIHPGTAGGGLMTRVGSDCLIMVGAHVAHDCLIGSSVIMANNTTLGGHVTIGDYAILGGLAAIHQFVRIGHHSMVGGLSGVENDVIPYGSVIGNRAYLSGLNTVGLKRRGYSREDIHSLRAAYRLLFAEEGTLAERLDDVADMFKDDAAVMEIVHFIQADSSRTVCQPQTKRAA